MKVSVNSAALARALSKVVSAVEDKIAKSPAVKKQAAGVSEVIILAEAQRLATCIQRRIDMYLQNYSPKVYVRDGSLKNSIRANARVDIMPGGTLCAYVDILETPGESVFEGGPTVDQTLVMDEGWHVKKDVWFKDKPHFGYFEGIDFINGGIADFNKSNPYNLVVTRGNE